MLHICCTQGQQGKGGSAAANAMLLLQTREKDRRITWQADNSYRIRRHNNVERIKVYKATEDITH